MATRDIVKIKIALSKDEVNATCGWREPIVVLLFKAMIPGSVSEEEAFQPLRMSEGLQSALSIRM